MGNRIVSYFGNVLPNPRVLSGAITVSGEEVHVFSKDPKKWLKRGQDLSCMC